MANNTPTDHPKAIFEDIIKNYKPVPNGGKADLTMSTSELWEKVEAVIPSHYSKAEIAVLLKEKGFTLVDETESFNDEWGFWVIK